MSFMGTQMPLTPILLLRWIAKVQHLASFLLKFLNDHLLIFANKHSAFSFMDLKFGQNRRSISLQDNLQDSPHLLNATDFFIIIDTLLASLQYHPGVRFSMMRSVRLHFFPKVMD